MSYLDLKNEIEYLKSQNNGYKHRIQKYQDIDNEFRVLKNSMEILKPQLEAFEKENKREIDSTISTFSNYKQLIKKAKDRLSQANSQRNEDIFNRMNLDKQKISSYIPLIDDQYKSLLDDIMKKILNLNIIIKADSKEKKKELNYEELKLRLLELKDLKQKIINLFNEIHEINVVAKDALTKEYDHLDWEINVFNFLMIEVKRIGHFVPSKELFNPKLLAQLGMLNNDNNNFTTITILQNIDFNLKQRQEEIRPLIEKIKKISKKVLLAQKNIMKIIDNLIQGFSSIISLEETKGKNNNLIEEIFNEAKNTISSQSQSLSDLINNDFEKEIEQMKSKIEEEIERTKNKNKIANDEFKKRWNVLLKSKCDEIAKKFKEEASIYFSNKKDKYIKDIDKIVDTFSKNTKKYIPKSLLGCTDEINEAREKYKKFKKLKNLFLLIKDDGPIHQKISELNFQGYRVENDCFVKTTKSLIQFIMDNIYLQNVLPFEALSICLIYPIKIEELDNAKIEHLFTLFNLSLELEIGLCILFTNENLKDSDYFEKKNELTTNFKTRINEPEKKKYFQNIEDLFITNFDDLSYNLGKFLDYIYVIKRDYCLTLELDKIEEEYFGKMYHVYHTRTRKLPTDSINNAEKEVQARNRLANAIFEFSMESITLQQKIEINGNDNQKISQFISKFLDKLYTDYLKQDCEACLKILGVKMVNLLFIERENIRSQIDLEFDSDLCLEDLEIEEIKRQIDVEIMNIIVKNYLLICEREGGKIMWIIFYDEYCAVFYKYFQKGFEMPKDFNQFFREYEEEMEMKENKL